MSVKSKFNEQDVNWKELESYGIKKEDLVQQGQMDKLLSGEPSDVISMKLTLLGTEIETDGTIQLVRKDGQVAVNIEGLTNH